MAVYVGGSRATVEEHGTDGLWVACFILTPLLTVGEGSGSPNKDGSDGGGSNTHVSSTEGRIRGRGVKGHEAAVWSYNHGCGEQVCSGDGRAAKCVANEGVDVPSRVA